MKTSPKSSGALYSLLWSLFFAVFLFTAAFLLKKISAYEKENITQLSESFSEVLHEKEKKATEILNKLATDKTKLRENFLGFSSDHFFDDNGIAFFAFRNDTLQYWSDNRISIGNIFNKSMAGDEYLRLGPAFCMIRLKSIDNLRLVAVIVIKNEYGYNNDFLQDGFRQEFGLDKSVMITDTASGIPVFSLSGEAVFYLDFSKYFPENDSPRLLFFLLFFGGFTSLLTFIFYAHLLLVPVYKNRNLFVFFFTVDILALRILMFIFKFPETLYSTGLFSPRYFAASEFLPSLGDLVTNILVFLIISIVFYKYAAREKSASKIPAWARILLFFVYSAVVIVLFRLVFSLLQAIVIDSVVSYNLDNIFILDGYSILGLAVIAALFTAFIFSAGRLIAMAADLGISRAMQAAGLLAICMLYIGFYGVNQVLELLYLSSAVAYIVLSLYLRSKGSQFTFTEVAGILILFSVITSFSLHQFNSFKEVEKRKSLARKLASGEDPIAEYLFQATAKKIRNDARLIQMLSSYPESEFETRLYIQKTYFTGYWDKFMIQLTLCSNSDSLQIEPDLTNKNCHHFFSGLVNDIGKATSCPELSMLNYGTGGTNYLSRIDFQNDTSGLPALFIELNSKFIPKGLGYPELLLDKKTFLNTDLSGYSYAKYFKNELTDAFGKYYYSIKLDTNIREEEEYRFVEKDGYHHLVYRADNDNVLIISKKNRSLLDVIAPFSFLFIVFAVFTMGIYLILRFRPRKLRWHTGFRERTQLSMVSVILFAFIIIGLSSFYFIQQWNNRKNTDIISEKALSILIEIQNKISDYDTIGAEQEGYISSLLVKFSNVFFTDINLFDPGGNLIASSRPQIFNEGLVSYRMHPLAYNDMVVNNKTLYIHKEKIGNLEYYSAYVPFRNNKNKLSAYINLPYFAKESELNRELSAFLVTFMNIWVFLIAISVITALVIAGRITRPLNVIREKISHVKLGSSNEKIDWKGADEIGNLIHEYNRMIDELAKSADLLARSERESAWREMAMQVAHEIKNPLTPMKLSVQHLEKSWKDKAPDWENRLERFVNTLVSQIDALSAIASEFSYFAKMPVASWKTLDINEVAENTLALFKPFQQIEFQLKTDKRIPCLIRADKQQIIRVLNNLLKNSVQAVEGKTDALVGLEIIRGEEFHTIKVIDNGSGISDEMKPRMFTPSFSTKTEGMGLGLAIVKSIVESCGGSIEFYSEINVKTCFTVKLPAIHASESTN